MVMIRRNPFTRDELHREYVPRRDCPSDCHYCGGFNGHGGLYRYSTETDGGRVHEHRGLFCSLVCHDAYRG